MIYYVLGKAITINTMKKPDNYCGSVFELTGDDSLKEIGLNETFYFKCKHGFSNQLPISYYQTEIENPQNEYQYVLSIFLQKSIYNERLTEQFECSSM